MSAKEILTSILNELGHAKNNLTQYDEREIQWCVMQIDTFAQNQADQENAKKDEQIKQLRHTVGLLEPELNKSAGKLNATQAKLDAANEQLTKNAKDHLATVQKYVDLRSGLNAIVRIKQADNVYLWDHDIQALLTAAKSDQTK